MKLKKTLENQPCPSCNRKSKRETILKALKDTKVIFDFIKAGRPIFKSLSEHFIRYQVKDKMVELCNNIAEIAVDFM